MTSKGKNRLLFICLGNICRSPAANGVMQKMVDEQQLSHLFEIDSAGIGSWHVGSLPDARMRQHGKARGYDFSHRARQFDAPTDFDHFDMIIVMDEDNHHEIMRRASNDAERAKVYRMRDFLRKHSEATSIPDPYYGGEDGFELVLDLIEDGCENLIKELTCTN